MKKNNKQNKQKVFVIGLDGATFEIIKPLLAKGKLPNIKKLMQTGSYGYLESTMPPVTPCAWTSSVTGKQPSKHSLFDFQLIDKNPEKTITANRTHVKAKAIWKLLEEQGKKSIVIDVPLTFPPENIKDGVIISRVMAPPKKNCVTPKHLFNVLKEKGYIKKVERKIAQEHGADKANKEEVEKKPAPKKLTKAQALKFERDRITKAFTHMKEDVDKKVEMIKWFNETRDWDFFMAVFMEPDHAGHTFWKDQVKVKKIYEKVDQAIGKIRKMMDDNTTLFIWSDHGFTSLPYSFNVNEWLYSKDLLFKKLDIPHKESMKELKKFLKAHKSGKGEGNNKLTKFRYLIKTDLEKTKAYLQSGTCYGIRINLEGRDTTGIVKKEEYELFRQDLINDLKKLKSPLTKKKVFDKVLRREDVYSESPFGADGAPDIFLVPKDMDIMLNGQFSQNTKMWKESSKGYGFHHTHGIVFVNGKGIKNKTLKGTHITDVAPTVLHILDVPIPEDIDGRIIKDAFEKNSDLMKKPIKLQGPSIVEGQQQAYSSKDEEKIRKRLEALGYIE
ncbi:MAG: alkaline phosphatase family protein [Candidatus Omnitrophica bacterium]|nr:alkaline phosphatase family protein [Candidatus Omnitrophota bacterium]